MIDPLQWAGLICSAGILFLAFILLKTMPHDKAKDTDDDEPFDEGSIYR